MYHGKNLKFWRGRMGLENSKIIEFVWRKLEVPRCSGGEVFSRVRKYNSAIPLWTA